MTHDLNGSCGRREAASGWKRRAAPVPLIYGLRVEMPVERLLDFLAFMMRDGEPVVQQGPGRFPKEAEKRFPSPAADQPGDAEWQKERFSKSRS